MSETFTNKIEKALREALDQEVKRIIEEEAKDAEKRVGERVRMLVGEIATKLFSRVDFDRFGPDLRISVRIPEPERPAELPDRKRFPDHYL